MANLTIKITISDNEKEIKVYNINADGSNKHTGRKRGRKPKSTGL